MSNNNIGKRCACGCNELLRDKRSTYRPGHASRVLPPAVCKAPDCDRDARSRVGEYCEMHYYRLRRNGTLTANTWHRLTVCSVEGCDKPERGDYLCVVHLGRVQRHGDTNYIPHSERDLPTAERNPHWTGDEASYTAVHQRARRQLGRAMHYECVDCGGRAQQWSYDHQAPDHRIDTGTGLPYSTDLNHYAPRCVPCHKRHDLNVIKARRSA